jgi:flagellar basal-body rod protein FlgB
MDADMAINNVLDLAARQASWLLARQNLVAENVANANTPGYRISDLKPF